jgi:hypothetical protein
MPVPESHRLKTCSEEQKQVMRLIYLGIVSKCQQWKASFAQYPLQSCPRPRFACGSLLVKLADHKSAFAVIQETVLLTGQIQWQLSMVAPMRGTTLRGLVYAMSNGAPDVLLGFDMC